MALDSYRDDSTINTYMSLYVFLLLVNNLDQKQRCYLIFAFHVGRFPFRQNFPSLVCFFFNKSLTLQTCRAFDS